MNLLEHNLVKSAPVARFYYKGTHSHPVRRTVLIIETADEYFRGYELREGASTRHVKEAPIKSYRRSKIATYSQLGAAKHRIPGPRISTLRRSPLLDLLIRGA